MDTEAVRKGRPYSTIKSGNRLREYRLRANMTQEELAKALEVRQENISKAETTGKGLGNDTWFRLSDLFDVDPRVLRGWIPPEREETLTAPA